MKLRTVTKLEKRNKTMLKTIDNDVMSNCGVIAILPTYDQPGAMRKPYSGYIVCKTHIFINSSLLSYKNIKQN